jgi:endoglucanase Acf2
MSFNKRPQPLPRRPASDGIVSTDPWAPYQLCPEASEADKAAYAALRAEVTEKTALSSVKELASQRWWAQQQALTYNADRDSRMLSLLRSALPHHKKSLDTAMINFQIDRKLAELPRGRDGRVIPESRTTEEALLRIKADPSLVSPKMLEEAYSAHAAHQASEAAAKKARNDALTQAQRVREAAASAAVTNLQVNGWA